MTDTICNGYAKNNKSITYLSFPENKGTNAARNAAIRASTGDYCIILDSDDYFVDDAIQIINNTVTSHPEYRHFMFAPNDVDYSHSILRGYERKELCYADFLSGKVTTGFIHCIDTDIMKRHPFDESVRIHEGVFFLAFYKEAGKMLFTNSVVTIRERGRSDSVTLDAVRMNKLSVRRGTKANEMMLAIFGQDMAANGCWPALQRLYAYLFDNYLLLGEYSKIKTLEKEYAANYPSAIPDNFRLRLLKTVRAVRLGFAYRLLLWLYLFCRYRILKKRTK